MEKYVDKVPTLALLTLGGLSEDELLTMPHVTREDVSAARKLLSEKGFSLGKCERCDKITWIHRVAWETEDAAFDAKLCIPCSQICKPPKRR